MENITYTIDGNNIRSLDEFWHEFSQKLNVPQPHKKTLDTLAEYVQTAPGTMGKRILVVWKNHDVSKKQLGYTATIQYYSTQLQQCHHSEVLALHKELTRAKRKNTALFDAIVETVRQNANTSIEMRLE
ncbi:MAG: barstar family protein [Candidatus Kapabacteria bacterium]|jgi:RNAse (barnase) inhibitor barstar|nr:barstar family protein [Candidatus Kapabacteria bacterium]